MIPELRVEGETVLTGSPMGLGEELDFFHRINEPSYGTRHYPHQVVAGSYLAVAVIGGNVAVGSLDEVKTRIDQTRDMLETADDGLPADLTREELLGDIFHAGLLGYFTQYGGACSFAGHRRKMWASSNLETLERMRPDGD